MIVTVRRVTAISAAYAVVGGILSLLGWVLGKYPLTDWIGAGIAIKANAAIAIAAGGAALLLWIFAPSFRRTMSTLGLTVASLGGLTLFEHLVEWNLGIDTLFFDEPIGAAATAAPGRMGPPASVSLLALGIAIALLGRGPRARAISSRLGLIVFGIALLSLTGYWYGAQAMYTIPRLTGIAFQTATMIAALSIGVLAANPQIEPVRTLASHSDVGMLARRLFVFMFVVPLGFGWLRIRGQYAGLYDTAFGTALRSVLEVAILGAVFWWSLRAIRTRDLQRLRAEDDLRAGERRLAHTLESITDAFVSFDHGGRFVYVNAAAEQFLGRAADQLVGSAARGQFPAATGDAFFQALEDVATRRIVATTELVLDERYFVCRLYPGPDQGVSAYFQDITARKRAEDALKDADRRKDEFLATLAHELRNPLAPIRHAAKIVKLGATSASQLRWAHDVIERQARHMARLLDDLLDVSRITRGRLELRREFVELSAVLEMAMETVRPLIESRRHSLNLHVPADPLRLNADALRLSQVFGNLLTNAAKYMEPGGRIDLCVDSEVDWATIRIRDAGIGIPPDMLEQVFTLFAQVKSALERTESGLGIGLALVRGLVELHGGSVEARSDGPGKGAEFIVRLPLAARLPVEETTQQTPNSQASVPSRRILVADDNEDGAESIAMLLALSGHEVRIVNDGANALHEAEYFRPHVALLDIGMPRKTGYEVCRELRQTSWGADMTIIAITGWGQADDKRQAQDAGFDRHLTKPIDPDELMRILRADAGIPRRPDVPDERARSQ